MCRPETIPHNLDLFKHTERVSKKSFYNLYNLFIIIIKPVFYSHIKKDDRLSATKSSYFCTEIVFRYLINSMATAVKCDNRPKTFQTSP